MATFEHRINNRHKKKKLDLYKLLLLNARHILFSNNIINVISSHYIIYTNKVKNYGNIIEQRQRRLSLEQHHHTQSMHTTHIT